MKFTRTEKTIAKRLDITPAALHALVRGDATGEVPGGSAAVLLERLGLVEPKDVATGWTRRVTDKGAALAREARRLGW